MIITGEINDEPCSNAVDQAALYFKTEYNRILSIVMDSGDDRWKVFQAAKDVQLISDTISTFYDYCDLSVGDRVVLDRINDKFNNLNEKVITM